MFADPFHLRNKIINHPVRFRVAGIETHQLAIRNQVQAREFLRLQHGHHRVAQHQPRCIAHQPRRHWITAHNRCLDSRIHAVSSRPAKGDGASKLHAPDEADDTPDDLVVAAPAFARLIATLIVNSLDTVDVPLGLPAAGAPYKMRANIGQLDCHACPRMYTALAIDALALAGRFALCAARPIPEDHMAIVAAKSTLASVIQEYGRPDIHIGVGEDESPYVPFKENVFIRHLAFDVRTNSFANILWVKKGGMLGRHRHRGPISACTLEGSWRYLEYDWVARPGSYVRENPGVIHTLISDDPNGMKTIFFLNGSLEFYDDNDVLLDTLDVFWFIDHSLNHCRAHNLKINEKLWI